MRIIICSTQSGGVWGMPPKKFLKLWQLRLFPVASETTYHIQFKGHTLQCVPYSSNFLWSWISWFDFRLRTHEILVLYTGTSNAIDRVYVYACDTSERVNCHKTNRCYNVCTDSVRLLSENVQNLPTKSARTFVQTSCIEAVNCVNRNPPTTTLKRLV